ncbi:MAG: hypothetical protein N2C12_03380 [Planctomycetales bacterium]
MFCFFRGMVAFAMLLAVGAAEANDYLVGGQFMTPRVTHFRSAPARQVTYYAPTCYQKPCQPATCQPAPACAQPGNFPAAYYPQATYRQQPVVARYPAVMPSIATTPYQRVVASRAVVSRPVVVRSKAYVPLQPVRNVGRFVAPGTPTVVYPSGY